MKYSEIIKQNQLLKSKNTSPPYKIAILSNITIHQSVDILEYTLQVSGVNAQVEVGDYDTIVQDASRFSASQAVLIFWELSNIIEGLNYKIQSMGGEDIKALEQRVKAEIDMVFTNLKGTALVLFNRFSALIFQHATLEVSPFEKLCHTLNEYISQNASPQAKLIDLDKIIAPLSVEQCIDWRYYYSSKAPYTIAFFKAYAEYVKPIFLSVQGKAKKALILDCDNTLWNGILGEDGPDGIDMSPQDKTGAPYAEIQHMAVALNQKGVIIGLCSKNNPEDVDDVLQTHPDIVLKEDFITIKAVNWKDKVSNLREMATTLNIGLDSFVFVDDSDFEVNLVREQLPEVTVVQVPRKRYLYPSWLRQHLSLFYTTSQSQEDLQKQQMYQAQVQRTTAKQRFDTLDDYLASLEIELTLYMDDASIIPRMAQMTQKTNQFNLTTKRYTETEIEHFVRDESYRTIAFEVSDRFGNSGITGLCILEMNFSTKTATIDSLLMSCRVLGRNIEYRFFDCIVDYLKQLQTKVLKAIYRPTLKNSQVSDLYDRYGFQQPKENQENKYYHLILSQYQSQNLDYIKVHYGRES